MSDIESNLDHKPEIIRSKEHFMELGEKLQCLFDNQQFCDVTLISADGEYRAAAHKVLLVSVSKYFMAMFGGSLSEAGASEVKLSQIDGTTLKAVLKFIYQGIAELTTNTVENLLTAAHILEINAMERICCSYMKKSIEVSNCLGISHFAKLHNYDELYNLAMFYVCEDFVPLREEDEFLSLNVDQLCELISMDDLRMSSEGEVFHSIMAWIDHKRDDRKQFMARLFSHLRFPLLTPNFIASFVEEEVETIDTARIVCKAFAWHAKPENRPTIFTNKQFQVRNFKDVIVAISGFKNSNSDLRVALYYEGLKEWIYTKWPGLSCPREGVIFTALGKKLLIAGGYGDSSNTKRVDCLNLETLEWTEFPQLVLRSIKGIIAVNDTVYAFGEGWLQKTVEPFKEWYSVSVSDASVLDKIHLFAVCENLIYFAHDEFISTLNLLDGTVNWHTIRRERRLPVRGLHIINYLDTDLLIEIVGEHEHVANSYDLTSNECKITTTFDLPWRNFKTQLHGEKLLIYRCNQIHEYDVHENKLVHLPKLFMMGRQIDVLLTNTSGEGLWHGL